MQIGNAVYRHVLEAELARPKGHFTENGIARDLSISPNTVSIAIKRLLDIGAAAMYRRHFEILSFDKALAYWAATRKFGKDIVYSTYVNKPAKAIEQSMPGETAYTSYTGYANLFGNDAADYGEVYVYATDVGLSDIKSRFEKNLFAPRSKYANLVVLKPDKVLYVMIKENSLNKSTVPKTQLYADLWNISEWNAYEFVKKLKKTIDDEYAKNLLQLSRN
ncbi:MAG: hypothetical protein M1128_00965 [Candidatus Marsarchaeota archaeon]|nr:hypothetical protein [Candidatus Marsarchaeota archaeon]